MSKKLISFRDKQRKRQQSRGTQKQRHGSPYQSDDLVAYWQHIVRHPLQFAGRQPWTERMVWSNALLAGGIRVIILTVMSGFHFLLLLTTFVNTLFLAFLFFYGMTWVTDWVIGRTGSHRRYFSVTDLRREMIVLSGWIVLYVLLSLVPFGFGQLVALLGFFAMALRAVHYVYRIPWGQALLATAAGMISMVAILYIFQSL